MQNKMNKVKTKKKFIGNLTIRGVQTFSYYI